MAPSPVLYAYGLNPIAIDPQNEWVYFGAMGGRKVYRISANDVADASRTNEQLALAIKEWADKPHNDGFVVDRDGNVYVTDVEQHAIGIANPSGYRVLVQDRDRLSWPDGLELTADGWLYVTVNQLHKLPNLNLGTDESRPPYYVQRIKVGGNNQGSAQR